LRAAVQTGQAQHARVPEGGEGLLPSARSQLVIPIRREARVIGLLMLESETDSRVDLGFLSRLSDHAAIAISNAQLYGEVERANLAKTEFVSFVAHELKSPMTSIKGYTELVAAGAVGEVNEMQANFLRTINSNVDRMSTLVSDLNDDSKIEAGRLRLDYKATALAGVLDEVIEAASRQVADKRHRLDVQFPPDLPAVWADSTRVSQVLTNLISNANKYTPEGGLIEVGAAAAANQWDSGGAARVVHIWVKDSGIGIGLEDQEKIFQKFFRSEDNRVRESSGSGLGLNITKSLVEMQGGRIWFESELGRGATFHFTVPVAEA
jgi:signal transduction histidine kinase